MKVLKITKILKKYGDSFVIKLSTEDMIILGAKEGSIIEGEIGVRREG